MEIFAVNKEGFIFLFPAAKSWESFFGVFFHYYATESTDYLQQFEEWVYGVFAFILFSNFNDTFILSKVLEFFFLCVIKCMFVR